MPAQQLGNNTPALKAPVHIPWRVSGTPSPTGCSPLPASGDMYHKAYRPINNSSAPILAPRVAKLCATLPTLRCSSPKINPLTRPEPWRIARRIYHSRNADFGSPAPRVPAHWGLGPSAEPRVPPWLAPQRAPLVSTTTPAAAPPAQLPVQQPLPVCASMPCQAAVEHSLTRSLHPRPSSGTLAAREPPCGLAASAGLPAGRGSVCEGWGACAHPVQSSHMVE